MSTRSSIAKTLSDVHAINQHTSLEDRLSFDDSIVRNLAKAECRERYLSACTKIVSLLSLPGSLRFVTAFDEDLYDYNYRTPELPIGTVTNGGDVATAQFDLVAYSAFRVPFRERLKQGRIGLPILSTIVSTGVAVSYGGGQNNAGVTPERAIICETLQLQGRAFDSAALGQLVVIEDALNMVEQRAQTEDLVTSFY